jgi:predicted nucleic-acid-binding Zn-ribbon protein
MVMGMFDFAETTKNMTANEILNYYRNLYYAEPQVTERGIVANAINDILPNMVEVVRCKKCAYYGETIGKDSGKPCGYGSCYCKSAVITGIVYDEDFCSYGERKDNERKAD